MAGPDEHQPLWERRDMSDQEREAQAAVAEPSISARFEAVRHRLPIIGAALLVVFIVVGVMRAIVGLFGSPTAAPALNLRLCVSQSFGARPLGDITRGFLAQQGAKSIAAAYDTGTGLHTYSAQIPGFTQPITMTIEDEDAQTAFDHLAVHECQVAVVAREMNPLEIMRFHTAPIANLIALDGAVVVVHPDAEIKTLTTEELRAIFSGELRNWQSITGENRPIHVVLPPRGADEISLFTSRILQGQLPVVRHDSSLDVSLDVSEPLALGSIGLTTFHHSDPARAVSIIDGGREATASTLSIGRRTYALTMPVYAYADESNMSNTAYQLLLYLGSTDGQNVLVTDGFISPAAL